MTIRRHKGDGKQTHPHLNHPLEGEEINWLRNSTI